MSLKIHFNRESEILNYEYECWNGNSSDAKCALVDSHAGIGEETSDELLMKIQSQSWFRRERRKRIDEKSRCMILELSDTSN